MRILYIHQYFKTPYEPGGTRSYWLAKELVSRGHSVTMITSSNIIGPKLKRMDIDGIDVIYIRVPYNQKMTLLQRLQSFLKFMILSTCVGWKEKKVELTIATSTPLTVGVPALLLKWFRKIPFVFEVRDLWPEVPIQMGALNNRAVRWCAKLLEATIYKNSAHIIALSPGMRDGVAKYVTDERISMIPNMAKKDEFWPRERNDGLFKSLGLSVSTFKVIHFGALGLANGIETVMQTAKLMKEDLSVQFVFLGTGSMEDALKRYCAIEKLNNVVFLPRTPMKETSEIVNLCDVSLVSFRDLSVLHTNSPNKLFDSLSAGKPVIVNSAGWTKDLVVEYDCGIYVNPNRPEELMKSIKDLQFNPDRMAIMGRNARRLAETKYDKTILCEQFASIVEEIIS